MFLDAWPKTVFDGLRGSFQSHDVGPLEEK